MASHTRKKRRWQQKQAKQPSSIVFINLKQLYQCDPSICACMVLNVLVASICLFWDLECWYCFDMSLLLLNLQRCKWLKFQAKDNITVRSVCFGFRHVRYGRDALQLAVYTETETFSCSCCCCCASTGDSFLVHNECVYVWARLSTSTSMHTAH